MAEETNHPSGIEKLGYVAKDGALTERLEGSSRSVKGVKMINTETFEIGDVKVSSEGIGNDRMLVSDVFKDGHDADVNLELNLGFGLSGEHCKSGVQNTPLFLNTSAAKGITGEGASNGPTKWMRAPSCGNDIVPNEGRVVVDKGKAALSAVTKQSQAGKRIVEHTQLDNSVSACCFSKAYNWGKFTKVQKPSASNEAFNLGSNTPSKSNVGFSGNKLPPLPGAATSSEKTLEAEKLLQLQLAEQPDFPNADPGNRLLKRLKLNPSTPSAQGRNFASTSSQVVKVSKLYGGIPRSGAPTTPEKQHGKKPVWPDEEGWNKGTERVMEYLKEKRWAFLSSHAWMKRMLRNDEQGTTVTRPEAEAIRDPQSSKSSVQEQKVPSVKALALIGKVLTRSQPYDFRKSGSCTVWTD